MGTGPAQRVSAGVINDPQTTAPPQTGGIPPPETQNAPVDRVDTYVTVQPQTSAAPASASATRGNWFTNLISRIFHRTPRIPDNYHTGHNGWIPLSDIVAFFETVKTHRLADIRGHYADIAANGFDRSQIYDVLMRRFNVASAQLEHDIGHQNPNPNRSITELTSNAVDAMNGRHRGNVTVLVEDGWYIVEDRGSGMSAEDVFEKLLIPQISGKSGEVTIGRFGIGFYTALVHLRNQNSRVIVETKREGQPAIRLEFMRLNGELGVRVGPSNRETHGTLITVIDDAIKWDQMTDELSSNMGYVLGRNIMVNGERINEIDSSHVRTVGNGRLYVSEESSMEGSVVITVGGVKIEEFEARGHPVPELVVLDFPLSTRLPESRNQIRVDGDVVNQVKAFIDAVQGIEGNANKIAYLNAIAPMITELQRRSERSERANDITEYAQFVAKKYLHGKTLIPDDPIYDAVAQEDVVHVNDLYLDRNWDEGFERPPEWRSKAKVLLTDFSPVAASGIAYDEERDIVILDRSLYEMNRGDPAGLEALIRLSQTQGTWNQARTGNAGRPAQSRVQNTGRETPRVDPRVARLIERHPVLAGQSRALESLAASHPEVLPLLQRLSSTLVNHGGSYREVTFLGPDNRFILASEMILSLTDEDTSYRLFNLDGTPALEGAYKQIEIVGKDGQFIQVRGKDGVDDGTSRLFNLDGMPAIEEIYRSIDLIGKDGQLIKVQGEDGRFGIGGRFIRVKGEDGLYRLLNRDGTPVIDGRYKDIYYFDRPKEGRLIAAQEENGTSYHILDFDGTHLFDFEVEYRTDRFGDPKHYCLHRLFRRDGTPVTDRNFLELNFFGADNQAIAAQGEDGLYRLLNRGGVPITQENYREMTILGKDQRFVAVQGATDGLWRLLNPDGTPAIEGSFQTIEAIGKEEKFIRIQEEDGGWRLLNWDGTPAIEGSYEYIDVQGRFFVVRKDGAWRILNRDGTTASVFEGNHEALWVLGNSDPMVMTRNGGFFYFFNLDGTSRVKGSHAGFLGDVDYKEGLYILSKTGQRIYSWDGTPAISLNTALNIGTEEGRFFAIRGEDGNYFGLHWGGTSGITISQSNEGIGTLGKDGRYIKVFGKDSLWRLLNPDGTPAIEGAYKSIDVLGKDGQFIRILTEDGQYRLLNSDCASALEGSYKWIEILGNNGQFIRVWDNDNLYRLLNLDGTPAFAGSHALIKTLGKKDQFIEITYHTAGFKMDRRLFNWDGTPVLDEAYSSVTLLGEDEQLIAVTGADRNRLFDLNGKQVLEGDFATVSESGGRIIARGGPYGYTLQITLGVEVLNDRNARRNLEALVNSRLNAPEQEMALSMLKLPSHQFDIALRLLPEFGSRVPEVAFMTGLLEILHNVGTGYTDKVLSMLCEIAVYVDWGDVAPENAAEKLGMLASHLSAGEMAELRDLLKSDSSHFDYTKYPPKLRAYLYYLISGNADLLPEGRPQVPAVTGSALSLVELNTAVRSHRTAWQAFNGSAERAARAVQRQTEGTDPEVSANRIRHAMYHLGDGQSLLFLRELIQNSLDAVRGDPATRGGTVNVESFEENGSHVLRITDPVGMSFTDALNNLFIFGESTKGEEDLGKFGVGFFTIYPGAKEVRIKTGTGDGKVTIFTLRPVYDGETVVDVTMSYVVRNENFKGTIIERVSNSEVPELDAAMVKSSTLSYGRFLDASEIRVLYNGRQVNLSMQPIVAGDVAGIGRVRIYEASENAFTVGGLFVKNIPAFFYELLPPAIRAMVATTGIVIDLPGSTQLVRSRNDFVDPANFESRLIAAVHAMLIQKYLDRFARGEIDIEGIPEVYFNSMYGFAEGGRIPQGILDDAERLQEGEGVENIGRYLDDRSFLQLLTLLPCLKVGQETISMHELLERVEAGDEIDQSHLPQAIRGRIESAFESRRRREEQRVAMDSVAQEVVASPAEGGRDLTLGDWREDTLHRHWTIDEARSDRANTYDALLEVIDALMVRAGNVTHVVGLSSFIERNALADHRVVDGRIEMYFSLTSAEKYAHELKEIISAEHYPAERMQTLMAELIDKVTHEMTHDLLESSDEWTHDPEFYRRQQQIITTLLRSGPLELEELWGELKAEYPNPTFLSATEFLRLLVTERSETPSGASPAATPSATPTPAPQTPPAPVAPAPAGDGAASASTGWSTFISAMTALPAELSSLATESLATFVTYVNSATSPWDFELPVITGADEEITGLPELQDEEWESGGEGDYGEYDPEEDSSTAEASAVFYLGESAAVGVALP